MPIVRPPDDDRVVAFRRGGAPVHPGPQKSPVETLDKYEHPDEPDDYRHRMITNVLAFAFVAALIGAGLWLADTMASLRKKEDCVMSGRRGCAPVEVPRDRY
jgi:hypothetical protein